MVTVHFALPKRYYAGVLWIFNHKKWSHSGFRTSGCDGSRAFVRPVPAAKSHARSPLLVKLQDRWGLHHYLPGI